MTQEIRQRLWHMAYDAIRTLEVENGILASGREEAYGCVFGRDSLITGLKLLRASRASGDPYLAGLVRKALAALADLQGSRVNRESGEEPGKCIHEFRPDNHERLTVYAPRPWYRYPDGTMRNYDSVDATPLFLIAAYRYWRHSGDAEFLEYMMPAVWRSLAWMRDFGDTNGDGFIDYCLPPERVSGGLAAQNWMDSAETLFHEDGGAVPYPIAPAEVQAYAYLAYRLWDGHVPGEDLAARAALLKERFNRQFVLMNPDGTVSVAAALDGAGKPLASVRSSMGHLLWAAMDPELDGERDSVLDGTHVPAVVARMLHDDLFEEQAGIRTLSRASRGFDAASYHNGSIWPHDNAMIAEGLERFGYAAEAGRVRRATFSAIGYFQTPIEMFLYDQGMFGEYRSPAGQGACRVQAWSAAAILEGLAAQQHEAVSQPALAVVSYGHD